MEEPESYYRDLLAVQVGGKTEVMLPLGRADVMNGTTIWEVEPITRWRHGAAQALQYAAQVKQAGALALYGSPGKLPSIFSTLARLPRPRLEVWWLTAEGAFVPIRSSADAASQLPSAGEAARDGSKPPLSSWETERIQAQIASIKERNRKLHDFYASGVIGDVELNGGDDKAREMTADLDRQLAGRR